MARTMPLQAPSGSAESSPMIYQHPLPGEPHPLAHPSHPELTYTGPPAHVMPHVYREFISQQLEHENIELGYGVAIPSQIHHMQFPELHQLHQQPLMGMPSGSQFMPNPHVLPLPYDPNFNEGYTMADAAEYFSTRSIQESQNQQ